MGVAAEPNVRPAQRSAAAMRWPYNNLQDSLDVANAVHSKGGGSASKDQLAAFLEYRSARSGTFLSRLAAARMFGFVESQSGQYTMTPLARKILMPVYDRDRAEGLVEAFLNVPLFKAMYEEHLGKELPPGLGLKNLFRTRFKVGGRMTDVALRTFLESADQAGFFATRGTKTHLIKPSVSHPDTPKRNEDSEDAGGFGPGPGGTGNGGQPPMSTSGAAPATMDEVKAEYVRKLISLLDSDTIEDKQALMDRIERVSGIVGSAGARD